MGVIDISKELEGLIEINIPFHCKLENEYISILPSQTNNRFFETSLKYPTITYKILKSNEFSHVLISKANYSIYNDNIDPYILNSQDIYHYYVFTPTITMIGIVNAMLVAYVFYNFHEGAYVKNMRHHF